MNRKMIKALKNKYIYVDIDGTIAEYRFNNHVNAKDGTTNGQTMKEIENHIFLYSRPLKTVIQTLKRAKKEGIPLKLISHIRNNRDRKGTIWTNPFFEEV